ncbi:netrin-4-like [Betta splendens]|uniref:Netrin-4-like n=1 Tax=Betta splendens TaxID=158456 RepID=A0A6P7MP46_BETSP|nr:netrin-4-like [Betta splendens]
MRLWTLLVIIPMCASSSIPAGPFPNTRPGAESRCFGRACNPHMGNLAHGRVLATRSVCGSNSSEPYCFYRQTAAPRGRESCSEATCGECRSAVPGHAHPPSAMSDSSFRRPDTWWQSAEGAREETLQLDLETEFLFTHLILVFRSPRPAAMVLERSQDFGRTWSALRRFAADCERVFGLAEGSSGGDGGAACTSKYSAAYPCTRGEVIYRALSPWLSVDPYGPAAQKQLMITNLRVRLLQHQQCPCQSQHPAAAGLPTQHYAIYDFIVKGSCLCNGHADHCVRAGGYRPGLQKSKNTIHGRCACRHNTAGEHCERCAPLYNDRPWQAANGITGAAHECRKCKCNNHARSCHFSRGLWLASGRRSGGVCDGCRHHTEGRHCQSCSRGHFRGAGRPAAAADSCQPCACHRAGSVLSGGAALCDPSSGQCTCKPGVGGRRCERCMMGYWGLHEYGCRPCDCTGDCDPYTGDCVSGSDVEVSYAASGHMGPSSNNSDTARFRLEELFSALHHSENCDCEGGNLHSSKLFCAAKYDYVLVVKVMSAHDKGSHAEVEVKVKKVLYQNPQVKVQRGSATLYPESWTVQGCTCPLLNPGSTYVVAGHEDWKSGRLIVNTRSLVKPWKLSLGHKLMHILRNDCSRQ